MTKYEEMTHTLKYAKEYRVGLAKILGSSYAIGISAPDGALGRHVAPFPQSGPHYEALRTVLLNYDTYLADEIARIETKLAAIEELLQEN